MMTLKSQVVTSVCIVFIFTTSNKANGKEGITGISGGAKNIKQNTCYSW
jgi:hypothetical protein